MATVTMATTTPRRFRLGARTRKVVLLTHIVAAGTWIGIDVAMAVAVFTAIFTSDPQLQALCYQALDVFVVVPLIVAGLLSLVSGVLLGLGTKYGLVKYWWIAVKLVLNVLLTTLALISLRPGIDAVAEQGRALAAGQDVTIVAADLVYPPIVSPALLLFAMVLSVFKPWGRTRKRERSQTSR